eukprot:1360484-Amorphochlora_amoeboformis.AAC.2
MRYYPSSLTVVRLAVVFARDVCYVDVDLCYVGVGVYLEYHVGVNVHVDCVGVLLYVEKRVFVRVLSHVFLCVRGDVVETVGNANMTAPANNAEADAKDNP